MINEYTAVIFFLAGTLAGIAVLDVIVSGLLASLRLVPFRKAFRIGLLAWLIPLLMLAYGTFFGRNQYEIKRVELSFDNLPAAFDGYKIVQISDIHSPSFSGRGESLAEAVAMVNGLEPDLVCFTGDIITVAPEELDITSGILKDIRARDGVLSILGNHDYCTYMEGMRGTEPNLPELTKVIGKIRETGWDLLLNENRILRRGTDSIAVVGVENISVSKHFPSTGDLAKASEGTDGMFRVLLSHDPTHWDMEVTGKDYPLTLSGHTHAMQFSLFGWCPSKYIFKQYRGLYKEGKQYLYVNIGLGETFLPSRIGTPPEITLITLRQSK